MFTGILLCGGKSRRMGRDKASLVLCGKPLLLWQADKLRALGAEELLLAGGTRTLPGARIVPDLLPERGPLGGLHACLTAASFEYCLVLPVDAPLVPEPALRALLDTAQGCDGAYLQSPRGPEPLLAVYHRRLAPLAAQLLASGPAPVRALLTQADLAAVPYTGDAALLQNCNTPEQFAAVKAMVEDRALYHQ